MRRPHHQATTKPDAPMTLNAPGGDGWQLHSRHPNAMSDVYSQADGHAPAPDQPVKTIADMPEP